MRRIGRRGGRSRRSGRPERGVYRVQRYGRSRRWARPVRLRRSVHWSGARGGTAVRPMSPVCLARSATEAGALARGAGRSAGPEPAGRGAGPWSGWARLQGVQVRSMRSADSIGRYHRRGPFGRQGRGALIRGTRPVSGPGADRSRRADAGACSGRARSRGDQRRYSAAVPGPDTTRRSGTAHSRRVCPHASSPPRPVRRSAPARLPVQPGSTHLRFTPHRRCTEVTQRAKEFDPTRPRSAHPRIVGVPK